LRNIVRTVNVPASLAGARIRALRSEAGLSAQALARRSGVARGTLAQLEAGEANPTIETLYALANTLGVALAELLAPPAEEAGVHVVRAGSGPSVPGAAAAGNLLERFDRPGLVGELYAVRFLPGEVRHSQPHPLGVVEHLHLHAGHVRVGPEDAAVELGPGDYARYDGSVPHVYEALGAEARGTLMMLTPAPRGR
jgi:transcriptional regulator with XRE-family HTH domain